MLQAVETLGVLAFIGAADLESTEATMELLWSIINHWVGLQNGTTKRFNGVLTIMTDKSIGTTLESPDQKVLELMLPTVIKNG
jgi:hypothetical protein